jgi:hypothetical protein
MLNESAYYVGAPYRRAEKVISVLGLGDRIRSFIPSMRDTEGPGPTPGLRREKAPNRIQQDMKCLPLDPAPLVTP